MCFKNIINRKCICFLVITTCLSCNNSNSNKTVEQDKLFALAKTYGYVKYFHPSDEAANLDWDSFAVLASKRVLESENLENTLEELFLPIAPSIQIQEENSKQIGVPTLPDKNIDSLQDIYWLHLGNGEGKIGNNYKSMRTHRKARVLPQSNDDYGGIRRLLDIEKLKGKEIRVTASIMPNSIYMGIPLLRVSYKRKDGNWKRHESSDEILKKNTWNSLIASGDIPEDTERVIIHFRGPLKRGSLDIDYLRIQVREDEKWIDYELDNSEFDDTETFDADWNPWGSNQEFDLANKNGNRVLTMSRHIGTLQEIPPLFKVDMVSKNVLQKSIGSGLELLLPLVVKGNKTRTFPTPDSGNYKQLLMDIESISSKIDIENENTRLANFIKTWSVFQHFYPYFDLTEVDWDGQFYEAVKKNKRDKTYQDHLATLKLMVAPLKDSHIGVYSYFLESYYPPISWELIENKLVVTNVLDTTLTIKSGDVVTKINGETWEKHWNESYKKASGATETRRNYRNIEESLAGDENSKLTIETSSSTKEINLKRTLIEGIYDRMVSKKSIAFKEIEPEVLYIDLSKMSWQSVKEKLPEIAKAKGVVFDLRGYPRGATLNLLSHFIKDNINLHQSFTPKIVYPNDLGSSYLKLDQRKITPKEPYIDAKKVFIIDRKALSFSESILIPIEYYKLADIVGEPTGGSTGNTNNIFLFGDIIIPWTGRKVLRQDGSVFHGRGVIPNYPVDKTILGVKKGKDEYLEYALHLINGV